MKKDLKDITNDELLKEVKNQKLIFGIYVGIILTMIICAIIITINKGVNTFTFLPVVFCGIAMTFWANYAKVKKELKSRNLN